MPDSEPITSLQYVYDFDQPPELSGAALTAAVGGKAANLIVMAGALGLPVPPGFVITTEACLLVLQGAWPERLDVELHEHMSRLGGLVGRHFGDTENPLLVSVRSGAPVSMPGMMDTILNLGLNEATTRGLGRAVGDDDFAADCLRRFHESYRAVIGSDSVPDDPWQQLHAAVAAVFASWNSDRAVAYRAREGIADDLGTAVTVQAMVFGNRGNDSATGVLFTRNPSTGEHELFGDVLFNAQGEDVVAGTHATQPIAVLDKRLPAVAAELRRHADALERHLGDVADVEFTIEDGRLWMLQARVGKQAPRAALRIAIDLARDDAFPLSREQAVERVARLLAEAPREFVRDGTNPAAIAQGLAASPGVAVGHIATSSDAAEAAHLLDEDVILVREETSPEDVRGMSKSVGILTSRGGIASHAAVVARGWGIPAVVGATAVRLLVGGSVQIGDRTLDGADVISIDGSTGEVFEGRLDGSWRVVPEAETLLGWAKELGIPIEADQPPDALAMGAVQGMTAGDVMRALAIMGSAAEDGLEESLAADQGVLQMMVSELADKGWVETAADQVRLTPTGKLETGSAFAEQRTAASVDGERGAQLLEEFHDLDARMKQIVTGWQVRDVGGEQVLNDHSDAKYDAALLDELGGLDTDTATWLAPLSDSLRQFGVYRDRLGHAVGLARTGDQRYVASPRVDSYHSVWFELHEHLIRLAGRRRNDEESAGRA